MLSIQGFHHLENENCEEFGNYSPIGGCFFGSTSLINIPDRLFQNSIYVVEPVTDNCRDTLILKHMDSTLSGRIQPLRIPGASRGRCVHDLGVVYASCTNRPENPSASENVNSLHRLSVGSTQSTRNGISSIDPGTQPILQGKRNAVLHRP